MEVGSKDAAHDSPKAVVFMMSSGAFHDQPVIVAFFILSSKARGSERKAMIRFAT